MFVEGSSAGAETALGTAYYTQDIANYYLPGMSDTLGLLDNAGNKLKNTYRIKGIGSMWGAMRSPHFITSQNAVPTIFFHGMLGKGVPYNIGHYWDCNNFAITYGSKPLYYRLRSLGVPAVAHIDSLGYHEVYTTKFREENIACFFNSIIMKDPEIGYYTTEVSNCP